MWLGNCSEVNKKSSSAWGYKITVKSQLQPLHGKESLLVINFDLTTNYDNFVCMYISMHRRQ